MCLHVPTDLLTVLFFYLIDEFPTNLQTNLPNSMSYFPLKHSYK